MQMRAPDGVQRMVKRPRQMLVFGTDSRDRSSVMLSGTQKEYVDYMEAEGDVGRV